MVAESIFSQSVKYTDLGVWLSGFTKFISPGVWFCCHFMPAGPTGIKAEQVLAKCRHTHPHVDSTCAHAHTPRTATPRGSAQTGTSMALSCSPLQPRRSVQRHWEHHTVTAYTAWGGSYTGKEKNLLIMAGHCHPQQQLHPSTWGFPRRAPEQSRPPRERCRMHSWRLSSWGLTNPWLVQPPVLLKRRRSRNKLSLKWGSRAMGRGGAGQGSTHPSDEMQNGSTPEVSSKQHFWGSSNGAQLIRASSCITSTTVLLICVTEFTEKDRNQIPFTFFFPVHQDKLERAETPWSAFHKVNLILKAASAC